MTHVTVFRRLTALALPAALLLLIVLIVGCGGGSGTDQPKSDIDLTNALEDPTQNGSIGGSVFTMAPGPNPAKPTGVVDNAYNAVVTLSGVRDSGGAYTDTTTSVIRGGYRFTDVPPGIYTVSATVHAANGLDTQLTGEVSGVRVRGNIPTLMANLLLCEASRSASIEGRVLGINGQPAAGATVSIDVAGYTTDYLINPASFQVSVILSVVTDSQGRYQFRVPIDGIEYWVAAHTTNSSVAETLVDRSSIVAGATVTLPDISLTQAVQVIHPRLWLDIVSTTLPAPTVLASEQATITRLAVARALHAPPARIQHLEQVVRAPRVATRSAGSFIENDLYWAPDDPETIRGYHIYRGPQLTGAFTFMGSAQDPYQWYFFDNDPSLQVGVASFYTVVSYGANGLTSPPAKPVVTALPLAQINVTGPDDGTIAAAGSPVPLTWEAVSGARSYVVTKFATEPTYNAVPIGTYILHPAGATTETFNEFTPGTYYWSVSAYNTANPNDATAVTCSAYRRLILQ